MEWQSVAGLTGYLEVHPSDELAVRHLRGAVPVKPVEYPVDLVGALSDAS